MPMAMSPSSTVQNRFSRRVVTTLAAGAIGLCVFGCLWYYLSALARDFEVKRDAILAQVAADPTITAKDAVTLQKDLLQLDYVNRAIGAQIFSSATQLIAGFV